MSDDLHGRLRAADPAPGTASVEAAASPRTRALMEAAMSTETATAQKSPMPPPSGRPRWLPMAIAAASAGVILAGSLLLPDLLDDDPPPQATAMELAMPGTDPAMASCLPLSAEVLRDMPVAFAGTATEVTDSTVALDVDTWYRRGDAASVRLSRPPAAPVALLGYGIDFREGTRYLITATGGTVNICGFSGEASPELEAAFDAAYRE